VFEVLLIWLKQHVMHLYLLHLLEYLVPSHDVSLF
jgi:hypothetical protein